MFSSPEDARNVGIVLDGEERAAVGRDQRVASTSHLVADERGVGRLRTDDVGH